MYRSSLIYWAVHSNEQRIAMDFPYEMMRKGFPHKVRVKYQADFEHQVIVLREIIVHTQSVYLISSFHNRLTTYLPN